MARITTFELFATSVVDTTIESIGDAIYAAEGSVAFVFIVVLHGD